MPKYGLRFFYGASHSHKISFREGQSKDIDQSNEIFLIRRSTKLVIRDKVVSICSGRNTELFLQRIIPPSSILLISSHIAKDCARGHVESTFGSWGRFGQLPRGWSLPQLAPS